MSYTKTNWQDLPNTTTPVTAANLNNMENGIKRSDSAVGGIDYDSTATYDKGEYCIYESVLYVANQNIDTPEAFNSAHWDATAVINELETLRKSGGIPTNSIIGYDGSTIPSGFEETDGPNDYSTTEKVIGKWIDNKPLYRITVNYTVSTGTGWNNVVYIPNVDFIFLENFTYKKVLGGSNPTELYINNYGAFQFYWTTTDSYVKEKHSSTYADGTPLEITFIYTKTTD